MRQKVVGPLAIVLIVGFLVGAFTLATVVGNYFVGLGG